MNYLIQIAWLLQSMITRYMSGHGAVDFHLIGAVTDQSAQIKITFTPKFIKKEATLDFTLYELLNGQPDNLIFQNRYHKSSNQTTLTIDLHGLKPEHSYKFEYHQSDKKNTPRSGHFKTFSPSLSNFTFLASSCATLISDSPVFNQMSELNPDFAINLGDLFYSATNRSKTKDFINSYHEIMKSPVQRNFYENHPFVYTFDDHDFGSNNADGLSGSGEFANEAYRIIVPHYKLASNDEQGVYHDFTVGKILFLVTDSRTFKNTMKDQSNIITNLGLHQMLWLKEKLSNAATDPNIEGVIIVKSFPWHSQREWNENSTLHEKEELAEHITSLGFNTAKNNRFLVMISGDTHMLTYDMGVLNEYGKFPIFQCSPLDSLPSCKQGGYQGEIFLRRSQFCQFEVSEHPQTQGRSCLNFKGHSQGSVVMQYNTCDDQKVIDEEKFFADLYAKSIDPTLDETERDHHEVSYQINRMGSTCPVPPKIKIQALLCLFGVVYFVLAAYTIMRNICYVRVE